MPSTAYLVTARKYRPQTFSEVVAQEHVTDTLKNAIRLDRLAHAYLFTGPRGVGKTTAARILAKAINCSTPASERIDAAEPCRTCDSCRSFEQGRNMNIIEIDAASNNKVEDIRELRETVRVPPQGNRMKVYIIDEVHMLSNAAFNALLKTLEEPPPHALFIFATTEPHKVLPTIQSRCQRFDFRRIAVTEIVEQLKQICTEEQVDVDEASLVLIARKGDGAMRDALSVFDQAVSLCGTTITHDTLRSALGVVDDDLYFRATQAVLHSDAAAMIQLVHTVVRAGYDIQEFIDGFSEHLRNLLVAITMEDLSLVDASTRMKERTAEHAREFSESTLMALIHIAGETADTLRTARQPRLRLEMALLKMASLPSALDLKSMLDIATRLEQKADREGIHLTVETQGSSPAKPARPASGTPQPSTRAPTAPDSQAAPPTPTAPDSQAAPPTPTAPDNQAAPPTPTAPDNQAAPAPPPESSRVTTMPSPALNVKPAILRRPRNDTDQRPEAGVEAAVVDTDELGVLQEAWVRLTSDIMESRKQIGSLLSHSSITTFSARTVTLAVPADFHARTLSAERSKLAHRLGELSGIHVDTIRFEVSPPDQDTAHSGQTDVDDRAFLEQKSEEYPAVRALIERFNGEPTW
ncbi:MAG: DNA polymerase III subunit gamma/tau [Bacteroidetes bacterium CG12_big_fil_rev_8_21_14_0_65_60_17]|nr:MAG: DNA polymerase III subunit gamma/tau [Bacteroidetes bacterium CG12_big_fil_rev_8_21_14_0_65_60_17]